METRPARINIRDLAHSSIDEAQEDVSGPHDIARNALAEAQQSLRTDLSSLDFPVTIPRFELQAPTIPAPLLDNAEEAPQEEDFELNDLTADEILETQKNLASQANQEELDWSFSSLSTFEPEDFSDIAESFADTLDEIRGPDLNDLTAEEILDIQENVAKQYDSNDDDIWRSPLVPKFGQNSSYLTTGNTTTTYEAPSDHTGLDYGLSNTLEFNGSANPTAEDTKSSYMEKQYNTSSIRIGDTRCVNKFNLCATRFDGYSSYGGTVYSTDFEIGTLNLDVNYGKFKLTGQQKGHAMCDINPQDFCGSQREGNINFRLVTP